MPSGIDALLHVSQYESDTGLFMFQPYRQDRITVIFVHGLASGPETWVPLYNQILADRKIRTRFQFGFWFYPTGQPALHAAADLRKALREAHHLLGEDPDSAFSNDMVVVAHSLGGILSSTLVTDSKDVLWNSAVTKPIDEIEMSDKLRTELKDMFFFEHLPFIKRVVYYSAPHRGAPEANTGFMQWASGLIHLPETLAGEQRKLRPYLQPGVKYKHFTVAQSLAVNNPVMKALTDLPPAPGVVVNCIIGDKDEAGKKGGTDGFVPYWSSHLDYAESELILHSGHSTEHKPEGARELERILHEHLAQVDKRVDK
jgi:pimeloyl-ACP methyl ester carboxylesterase